MRLGIMEAAGFEPANAGSEHYSIISRAP